MAEFKPRKPGKRHSDLTVRLVEVVVLLLVIYAVASLALGFTSVTYINAPTNVTFTNATSLFSISGNKYAASVVSSTSSSAQVSITRVPAFQNPTYYVTMYLDNTTNFNGTDGKYANMQLKLLSTGSESAVVEITPVQGTIVLTPTYGRITKVAGTLTPVVIGGKVTVTTVPTTTIAAATTSIPTTAPTTVPGQVNGSYKAQSILASSQYFALMNNYTILYKNTVNCTSSLYNFTFNTYNHFAPSGPSDYVNVSKQTPYSTKLNITNSSTSVYTVTYNTISHSSQTNGTALSINIDVVAGSITGVTYEGAFGGLTYAVLSSSYTTAKNLGSCGIMVA